MPKKKEKKQMPNIHASNSSKAGVQNTAATQGSATAMVSKLINYLLINISKQIHIYYFLKKLFSERRLKSYMMTLYKNKIKQFNYSILIVKFGKLNLKKKTYSTRVIY